LILLSRRDQTGKGTEEWTERKKEEMFYSIWNFVEKESWKASGSLFKILFIACG
jgi:hypothetical protein